MEFVDPNDIWKLRNLVLSKISIIDLAKDYDVKLEPKDTGVFSHWAYCPFHVGKGRSGRERTPSLFFSKDSNSFHCFGCVKNDTPVWTSSGLINAEDVIEGNFILGHDGEFHKILHVEKKKSGNLLSISTASFVGDPIFITTDHTCICIKKEDAIKAPYIGRVNDGRTYGIRFYGNRKNRSTANIKISEIFANNLKVGDFLLFPIIKKSKRFNLPLYKDGVIEKCSRSFRTNRINFLPINKNLAWLYGLWLSKGYVNNGLRFIFKINKRISLAEKALKIIIDNFKVGGTIFEYPKKNTCELIVNKMNLEKQFSFWFGKDIDKKIPCNFLFWSQDIQCSLIKGYMDGSNSKSKVMVMSKDLAYGIYCVAIQAGMLPFIRYYPEYIDKNGVKYKNSWRVYFRQKQSLSGFTEVIDNNEYYISIVNHIKNIDKKSEVVDMVVNSTNSFTTNMCVVHNCGRSGSVLDFVMYMDGTPPSIALEKLAKKLGLIDKNGKWDDLQLDAINHCTYETDPRRTIDPYLFEISSGLRNYIKHYVGTEDFRKELKWMERVAAKVDKFLVGIGHEDWEYVKEINEKVQKSIKNRIKKKDKE